MDERGDTEARTFCRICVASCGLLVTVRDGVAVHLRGDPEHPVSQGYACPKGRSLAAHGRSDQRLRAARLGPAGRTVPVPAEVLLDDLAARLGTVVDGHGADAVAVYASGGAQFDVSGGAALSRLTRGLGTRSRYTPLTIDAPAKPLVAGLVGGHPGLVPHPDPGARLTLLVGTNPVVSHGHASAMPNPTTRLRALARSGRLVVVDPRRTESARLATTHLRIRPGGDGVLLAHLVRALLERGADRAYLDRYARGVAALTAAVARFDLATTVRATDLSAEEITGLVDGIRAAGRIAVLTGTGATMGRHANLTEWLAWCLAVVTGSFDQPGGMWFNPGFLARLDTRVATLERAPEPGPRSRPELFRRWHEFPAVALVDEIEAGNVRALLVMGGNPVTALPQTDRVRAALGTLDVLATADIVESAVTAVATHVMPATAPLERPDVTYKAEQLFPAVAAQYTRAVLAAPTGTRPLWWWLTELGRRLGIDVLAGLPGTDPAEELAASVCGDPETFQLLRDADGAVVREGDPYGWVLERGLPLGYWRLAPAELLDQLAQWHPDDGAPLVLTPRRQRKHFNSTHSPGGDVQEVVLSERDAADRRLTDGNAVRVTSTHGSLVATLRVDGAAARGLAALAHGHPDLNVNVLTTAQEVDPLTGMPVFSGLPVEITPVAEEPTSV